jgi:hypothetical protein
MAEGMAGRRQFQVENVTVEEQQRAERNVLGGRGDPPLNGQVREVGADVRRTQVLRVRQPAVKLNEAADDRQVGLLGPVA